MAEVLTELPLESLQDYYVCHVCGNYTRCVLVSSICSCLCICSLRCICFPHFPILLSFSDLAGHFEDEKHLFGHSCPDPHCGGACASAPALSETEDSEVPSAAEETLLEHFLRVHHRPPKPNPTATTKPATSEESNALDTEEKEEAEAKAKAEAAAQASTAAKAAFVTWLGLHGKAAHPTAADIQAKVTTYTERFVEAYLAARESSPDLELGEQLTWDGVAAVYTYTLETEIYSKVQAHSTFPVLSKDYCYAFEDFG